MEPVGESVVPELVAGFRRPAKLEGDAAEDEAEQHDDDRQVERRHDHRIGERKSDEQASAAEHQPRLVAVPERRHRVHHHVAALFLGREREENAEPEIEAVEDDVKRHRDADDAGPDDGKPVCDVVHNSGPLHRIVRRRFRGGERT